jgi:hypothetical protein
VAWSPFFSALERADRMIAVKRALKMSSSSNTKPPGNVECRMNTPKLFMGELATAPHLYLFFGALTRLRVDAFKAQTAAKADTGSLFLAWKGLNYLELAWNTLKSFERGWSHESAQRRRMMDFGFWIWGKTDLSADGQSPKSKVQSALGLVNPGLRTVRHEF